MYLIKKYTILRERNRIKRDLEGSDLNFKEYRNPRQVNIHHSSVHREYNIITWHKILFSFVKS